MNSMGLMQEFIDALMSPAHAKVCNTEHIMYWIEDAIRMRLKTIDMLNLRLKRTVARGKSKKKAQRTSIQDYDFSDPATPSSTTQVIATVDGPEEAVNKILPRFPAVHICCRSGRCHP